MHPNDLAHLPARLTGDLSRRAAIRGLSGGGLVAALAAAGVGRRGVAAQQATATAATVTWQRLHLEVDIAGGPPVTISRAGGGPPQRGDAFYVDAPIFAAGNVNGTQIGVYQCFGAWTHAATDTTAPDQVLTGVQYRFADGALTGLINEAGAVASYWVGAVAGGTGKYAHASGTFRQITVSGGAPPAATPGVAPAAAGPGTPAAGQLLLRAVFDLILPAGS